MAKNQDRWRATLTYAHQNNEQQRWWVWKRGCSKGEIFVRVPYVNIMARWKMLRRNHECGFITNTENRKHAVCFSSHITKNPSSFIEKNHVCAFFALKKCYICNDWQLESQAPPPWPTPLGHMKCWSLGPCSSLANQLWVLQSHWLPRGMLLEALCSVEQK